MLLGVGALAAAALMLTATQSAPASQDGYVILPSDAAGQMYHQCSRYDPSPGDGYWTPDADDVAALESALPGAILAAASPRSRQFEGFSHFPNGWLRQYVGITREGHRFLYGNFFPKSPQINYGDWRANAVVICDGGPAVFGAEFDMDTREFTHIAFNG